ncbi:hypothetical protein S245_007003 [Arachis hypogaea]
MTSRLGSDNDADNNKGSMWTLEQKLDQPMDEEAAKLKNMYREKIRQSMHAMIKAPKSQTMIRKYCVDMTMTDNNISTISSCKQTKGVYIFLIILEAASIGIKYQGKHQSISRITTHYSGFSHSNILSCHDTNNIKTWLPNCHYLLCFWATWLRDPTLDSCCAILVVVCNHQCGSIISSLIVHLKVRSLTWHVTFFVV